MLAVFLHLADCAQLANEEGGRAFKFRNWPAQWFSIIMASHWPILKFEHATPGIILVLSIDLASQGLVRSVRWVVLLASSA